MDALDWAEQQFVKKDRSRAKLISRITGLSEAVIYNKGNPKDDRAHFNLKQLRETMNGLHDYLPLEILAEECGFKLMPNDVTPTELLTAVLNADKEHGDIAEIIQKALTADVNKQVINKDVKREISEARKALDLLEASWDVHVSGGVNE
nr:hypothetical protein 8 [Piscirickettsiaceae bacterium]